MRVIPSKRIRSMPTSTLQKRLLANAYRAIKTMRKYNGSITLCLCKSTAEMVVECVERFMSCEMDLAHSDAIIDGSWPNADTLIQNVRKKKGKR